MQRNFKTILTALFILAINMSLIAQSEVEYKDVILDGKPAKLNVKTGEITLVNAIVKSKANTSVSEEQLKLEREASVDSLNFHIVQEGEVLLDLSRKYKVSLTELKRVNNLETTLISEGQKLRVKNFDLYEESIPESVINNTTVKKSSNFHIVESGETLYSLSRRYNLSQNELKNKNNLNTNLIKVGQKLRVSNFGVSNEFDNMSVWTVSKGDTLFSIAKKSGSPVEVIKKLNGLTSNIIMIGQILQLK